MGTDEQQRATLRRMLFGMLAVTAPSLTRAHAFEIEALIDADQFRDAVDATVAYLDEAGMPVDHRGLHMIDALAAAMGLTESLAGGRARLAARR